MFERCPLDSNPFPGTTPNRHFPFEGSPELYRAPAEFFDLVSPWPPDPLAPDLWGHGTRFAPGLKHCMDSPMAPSPAARSEEHTSELQSRLHLVCRLLLEKKKKRQIHNYTNAHLVRINVIY